MFAQAVFLLSPLAVLWFVAAVVVVWGLLPPLLDLLGWVCYRNGVVDDTDDEPRPAYVDRSGTRVLAWALTTLAAWFLGRWLIAEFIDPADSATVAVLEVSGAFLALLSGGVGAIMAPVIAGAGEPAATGVDEIRDDVCRQLEALGFRPLGTCREDVWFFGPHWLKTFLLKTYGSREHQAFACIYRFVADEPIRVALTTCFADEAMVWTGNHSDDIQLKEDDYLRWGYTTNNMAELLGVHGEAVAPFRAAGRVPGSHDRFETLLPVMGHQSSRFLHQDKSLAKLVLGYTLFFLITAPGYLASQHGMDSWTVPLGIIVGGLLKVCFEQWMFRQMARQHREEVARGGPLPEE